jgi:hypothetical protein
MTNVSCSTKKEILPLNEDEVILTPNSTRTFEEEKRIPAYI